MNRLLNCSMSTHLRAPGTTRPLELMDVRRIKREKNAESEIECGEGEDDCLRGIKVLRTTKLVLANVEARFEVINNEITVPLVTKSKLMSLSTKKTYPGSILRSFRWKFAGDMEGSGHYE